MSAEHPVVQMSDPAGQVAPDRLPRAAWALAVACLVSQLVYVAEVGLRPLDSGGTLGSVLIGPLVVGWFAAGVLTARRVRAFVTWLIFVLLAVGGLVTVLDEGFHGLIGWPGAHLLTSLAQLAALAWFTSTHYYRWQRSQPGSGPSRAPLIACAVLVGLLGGVAATIDPETAVQIRLG